MSSHDGWWIVVGKDIAGTTYYPVAMRKEKAEASVIAHLRQSKRGEFNTDSYVVMTPIEAMQKIRLPWNMIELLVKASSDVT